MPYEIKQNDRRPRWRVQLTANGVPVDLTGAIAVRFTMSAGGTIKVNKAAMSVVDTPTGVVEYVWQDGDTDTAGAYQAEVEVDWGGGELQTFPSRDYFSITVYADLA